MSSPRSIRLLALLAAASVLGPARAAAQVVATPYVGVYVAGNELFTQGGPADAARQKIGPAVGLRLTLSGSGILGLEGSIAYTPSDVRFTTAGVETPRDGELFLASLRAILIVNSVWAPVNVYLGAGGAMVRRSGPAFAGTTDQSTLGGTVALGVLVRLGSAARLRFEAEDYITTPSIDFPGAEPTAARTQHDFVISGGVSFPLAF